ncbi:MAG: TonB-dependent receptor [Bacillota bacterium]|nr:TonB-dependent receptor [Bacillota bacterium]
MRSNKHVKLKQLRSDLWLLFCFLAWAAAAMAQTAGEGAIRGTVTDPSGAVVAGATVTATNTASGTQYTRTTSSDGLYVISPVVPGAYSVSVSAAGFQSYKQENLTVNALTVTPLNITLSVGSQTQQVTVTAAPPALQTTTATLGGVMENREYQNLPILMGGQQRDPTAFATLMPGTQGGTRAPVIGGTGNYLAEVYLDGLPTTTINQQGDNRVIFNAVPVEAVDQFQVVTSIPGAEYQGAGLMNFTVKSGGDQYHGTVADYVRARMFDTWGFAAKALTVKNAAGQTVPAPKPDEHQNELVGAVGGPIPFTKNKGFFFIAYDRYHGRSGVNPNTLTVPTMKMRQGDFSELLTTTNGVTTGQIYDPTSEATCTAHSTNGPCRYQFGYGYGGIPGPNGNPVPTGSPNVIPQSYLSPIALYMQKFLPEPTNSQITNNYLGGVPSGYDNWETTTRVDFNVTESQKLSGVFAYGYRENVPFTVGNSGVVLPPPYTNGGKAIIKPVFADVEHSIVITPYLVNQFKFGYTRFAQPVTSITDGVQQYMATTAGITNLPQGQASNEFPGASFSASTLFPQVQSAWTANGASGATQNTVPNAFTLVDNLQWVKGNHSMTFGVQMQWLQDNLTSQATYSGILTMGYNANSTANFATGSTSLATNTSGYSYASYLLGAVGGSPSIALQPFSETGGRYNPISPYFQDDWKVTKNLTLNLGLRWDYFPPFKEVLDRWSFLNATGMNPATGTPGVLEFAGHRGADISCNCRTPVHTYWKNFGPRLGFAYQPDPKSVVRGGFAVAYSHAGGVGGRGGAGNGTGQLGFTISATAPAEVTTGASAGPSFYLNNSQYFQSIGLANTAFGGPGYTLPVPQGPSTASLTLNTGNYVSNGKFVTASSAPGYADPYLSGRAPEFVFYSFGIQHAITDTLTASADYVGSQSHFVAPGSSNIRGYWSDQLDPVYLAALGGVAASDGTPILNALATPANVAIAKAAMPGLNIPSVFVNSSTKATIATVLRAFPQYSGVSDTWGQNSANISYNSFQFSLQQRPWHGLSYMVNYTYSKNLGDDGTFRSGFAIPAGAMSNGKSYKMDRIERSYTTISMPQTLSAFGLYQLPFGKGAIGNDHFWVRTLAGGWQLSSIYTYHSGTPLAVTWGGCTAPGQGQCMPDINPAFFGHGSARKNGSWGKGITAKQLGSTIQYIDVNAFSTPATFGNATKTPVYKIGDAPRTAPWGLWGPSAWNMDASLQRAFQLTPERLQLVIRADCSDVFNHNTKGGINTAWGPTSTTFGTVGSASGNRDWQFSARVNF